MDITDHRACAPEHASNLCPQIGLIPDDVSRDTISLGDLPNIRQRLACAAIAAYARLSEEALLGSANRRIAIVVKDKKLDRQLHSRNGLEFLDVELEAAVSVNAYNGSRSASQASPY